MRRVRCQDARPRPRDAVGGGAIDEFGVRGVSEAGNKLGMQDAVDESGNSEEESNERARSTDIKQGPVRADRRANQDEGAERAG